MTKNDITRGLIDFAVSQCLKNIKEDPYRSIRRLADLGRQFAKGRFQEELFSLFQRLLLNEDGPYYEMLKQLVSSVDTDSLKTLGINIGYNSWTCGASRLRQITAEKDYPHWLLPFSGKLCLPVKRTALRRPEKWYLRVPSPYACPEHYHRHQTAWAYPRIS